mgnify:CR=1 FL=1
MSSRTVEYIQSPSIVNSKKNRLKERLVVYKESGVFLPTCHNVSPIDNSEYRNSFYKLRSSSKENPSFIFSVASLIQTKDDIRNIITQQHKTLRWLLEQKKLNIIFLIYPMLFVDNSRLSLLPYCHFPKREFLEVIQPLT